MVVQILINGRYERKEKLGEGGMGVVYRAYDVAARRDVALKTMRDTADPVAVELFSKEWSVLAGIVHPNIVDLLDCGEFTEDGKLKPFFVMPLLPGKTLNQLIHNESQRLTVERTVEILRQVCRGLQAAHERGLVHRDLKPSNILVMDDDTAKIIDFGIVHLTGLHSVTGFKGTVQYMAPEQLDLKPANSASDIFSLGVVGYEALTGRQPFARKDFEKTAEAVRFFVPPPCSSLNPAVNDLVSKVVHKAMAKQASYRYSSAREFADDLEKALRNIALPRFEARVIRPRIELAKKAFGEGDFQFALEILNALEAEGNIAPEMTDLRRQVEQAIRQRTIKQLLEVARTRFEQGEDLLAIQKLDEALQLDPDNAEVTRLYAEIEGRRSERQIDDWLHLATDHLDGGAFPEARKAIEEALKLDPRGWRANQLLADLNRREQETTKTRAQKEQLSRAAKDDFESGDISTALSKLERVLELIRRVPDRASPDRDAEYQRLYNLVRSEHDSIRIAYEDACRCLAEKAFDKAAEICDEQLKKHPNQDLFRALKLKIGEQKRQDLSAYSAEVTRRVDAEADLDRKFNVVKEAVGRFPNEVQFKQLLSFVREKRDFVFSIVAKARLHEERGQFSEAIGQWEIVGNIYPQYPDLEFEVEQLRRRREEQLKDEGKARWVEQIERCLEQKDFTQARELSDRGLTEHPGDGELEALSRLAQQGIERNLEAKRLLEEGSQLIASGKFEEGCVVLRRALDLDENNPPIRLALIKGLVDQAKDLINVRWQDAEPFIHDAEQLDPNNTDVRRLRSILQDNRRKEAVNQCLARARDYQANGDILKALSTVEEGLKVYPAEARLWQLRNSLQNAVAEAEKRNQRNQDLAALRDLQEQLLLTSETRQIDDILDRSQTISLRHADDRDFGSIFLTIREHATSLKQHFPEPPPVEQPRPFETEQEPVSVPAAAQARRVETRRPVQPAPIPAAKQPVPKPVAPVRTSSRRLSANQWIGIVSVPVLIAALWLATTVWRMTKQVDKAKPAAAATAVSSEYRVAIETDPPGGTIRLNNRTLSGSPYSLSPGKQTLQANMLGYVPATRTIDVGPGTESITIPLIAEPVRLRLNTDFSSGQVVLDGNPVGVLQSGLFAKDDIAAGDHTLQVIDNDRELISVQFKARPGKPASLLSALKDRDVFVVSKLGSAGRLFAGPTALRLKDQPAEALAPDTTGMAVGRNEISLAAPDGSNPRSLVLESPNAPTLLVFSNSAALLNPALTIVSNVDNPQIFVNGMARNWRASHSKYMNRLEPGKYTVRLSKPGFADAEQSVILAAGDSKTLTFSLAEKPSMGSLEIPSGTPGAEVFLDQTSIGHLDASGKMNRDKVPPGQHEVMLKKDLYETRILGKQTITVGQPLQISPEIAHLVPLGFLSMQIATPGIDVKYKRDGETEWHPAPGGDNIPVKAGKYQTVASAEGYQPFEQFVAVEPGKTAVISGSLTRIPSAAKPLAVDLFGTSLSWVRTSNGWREFKGGGDNYGFLTRRQGTFNVDIQRKGSRFGLGNAIVWVIGYRNQGKDKVEYRINKNGALTRKVTIAGKTGEAEPIDAKLNGEPIRLQFEIAPNTIVIRENGGPVLDSYSGARNITDGDFGFKGGFLLSVTQIK